MTRLEVEKKCSCFDKFGLEAPLEFQNQNDAEKKAEEMLYMMNEKFCGKHHFTIVRVPGCISIIEEIGGRK